MHIIKKATIYFDTNEKHPDSKNAKGLEFTDTYRFDMDYFDGDIDFYIKHDLALVAGGGYDTDTIENVRFTIKAV